MNDVDFFTVEFVDDSLNTNAFLANAGTDGVDPFLVTGDSDFGSIAGFAGNAFGDNTTGANFRDFAGKEGGNKTGIGTANDDLLALEGIANVRQENREARIEAVIFVSDLFLGGHDSLAATDIDNDVFAIHSLDHTGNDFTEAVFEFSDGGGFFGFTNGLKNDLFGSLGGDAAKTGGGDIDEVLGGSISLAGFEFELATFGIKIDGNHFPVFLDFLGLAFEIFIEGSNQSGFDGVEDYVDGNISFTGDLIEGGGELGSSN